MNIFRTPFCKILTHMYHGWLWSNAMFSFHSTLNRACISEYRNVHTFRTGVEVIPIFPCSRKRTFGIFTPKNNENGYGKTYSVQDTNLTARKFCTSRRARAKPVRSINIMLGELGTLSKKSSPTLKDESQSLKVSRVREDESLFSFACVFTM